METNTFPNYVAILFLASALGFITVWYVCVHIHTHTVYVCASVCVCIFLACFYFTFSSLSLFEVDNYYVVISLGVCVQLRAFDTKLRK
jgi:hypothetical protein